MALSGLKEEPFLYKLHPVAKMIALVCLFLLAVQLESPGQEAILLLFIALLSFGARGQFSSYYRKIRTILYFSVFIFLGQMFFTREGVVLCSVTQIHLVITDAGIQMGLATALRFLNIIVASFLFVATTDGGRLAAALMQIGVPYRLAFLLTLAMRFIPVFGSELAIVRNAQSARGLDLESGSVRKIFALAKYTFVPLIVNALSRADGLAMSMEGRGFGMYKKRTYLNKISFTARDMAVAIGFVIGTAWCLC